MKPVSLPAYELLSVLGAAAGTWLDLRRPVVEEGCKCMTVQDNASDEQYLKNYSILLARGTIMGCT